MPFLIPNEADASTYPQQSEPDSLDFSILAQAHKRTGVLSGCAMTATGSTLVLTVASGAVGYQGLHIAVAGNTVTATADGSNPRWGLVTINSSGTAVITMGTAAANPAFPAIPSTSTVLYAVWVPAGATTLSSTNLVDKRVDIKPNEMLLTSTTSGSSGSTMVISGIPAGYRDLRIVMRWRVSSHPNAGLYFRLNSVTSGYYLDQNYGYPTNLVAGHTDANAAYAYLYWSNVNDGATEGTLCEWWIPDYQTTTWDKGGTYRIDHQASTTDHQTINGSYRLRGTTAAITGLTVLSSGSVTFAAGWEAYVYGVSPI